MEVLASAEQVADAIVEKVGQDLRVAAPLAAGKPNHILNALYRRAKTDSTLQLTILTALTLEKPKGASDLERRFMGPFAERVFGDYPDLDYELDRKANQLPANVHVVEFYFPAGKFLSNNGAQRDYISTNYTHVARDVLDRGVNVVVAQVAERTTAAGKRMLSLSCNADVAMDVLYELTKSEAAGAKVAFAAQINRNLPFMYGDAEVDPEIFHFVADNPAQDYRVFGPPKMAVDDAEYLIGLYASTLIRDGGELQIGIGALADSIVYALLLRQRDNARYRKLLGDFGVTEIWGGLIDRIGDLAPFQQGLLAASEMMVDGFLTLFDEGIIRREVFDDVPIQRLINRGRIGKDVTPQTVAELRQIGAIGAELQLQDVQYLKQYGVFRQDVRLEGRTLINDLRQQAPARIGTPAELDAVCSVCLGSVLERGAVMHAGFFLGPNSFYEALRTMPEERRRLIQMRSVRKINQLYGHEEIDSLHRQNARFVNTSMYVTLLGAAASDALEDGRVISGVGGQYNFVAMAHELPGGRSILNVRATRGSGADASSTIVWNYGHTTIPRHLRDIVISEYGIAELRGRTDQECVQAMLNIADSRFQPQLMAQAKRVGKLASDYQIPERFRHNTPERLGQIMSSLKTEGLFPAFPFGCEFTEVELKLGKALRSLKAKTVSSGGKLRTIARALVAGASDETTYPYLVRMGLDKPSSLAERLYARMLAMELRN